MARKIKRLADVYISFKTPIREDNPGFSWWRDIGINIEPLRLALDAANIERRTYEDQLRSRVDRHVASDMRAAKRALKRAAELIRLLKTEPSNDGGELFFGDLGETIEHAVRNYIDTRRTTIAAHRPGDPWLRKLVLRLFRVLRARGISKRRSTREIHELLVFVGHDDLVTEEKVRHIVRRVDVDGRIPKRLKKWWFTEPLSKRRAARQRR